jgi:Fe-S cluster assembly iron-binding protein IscA
MIDITDRALKELKRILSYSVDYSYGRLRLIDRGKGHLGLGIDIELPGDEVVEYEGSGLLVMEQRLAASLDGITIDVDDTDGSAQLVIVGEPKSQ